MVLAATFTSTILLCLIHLFVGRMRILDKGQGIWKSAAGGVGIAYTFLVLLPKVAKAQPVLEEASQSGVYGFLVHHSYLVALAGLVIYYGMDAAVENVLVQPDRRALRPVVKPLVYVHASVLSGYYFLVSYLMTADLSAGYVGYVSLAIFVLAMLLHYATIDHGLRAKYGGLYDPFLRWTFVVATSAGWVIASTAKIPYASLALLNCLFAGALIFFTLKEKVPGSDRVRFWPFFAGVSGYAMLLLIIEVLD